MDPLFNDIWAPVVLRLSDLMGGSSPLYNILVGRIRGDEINFVESFGLLTSGLYVPLAMVLSYIVSFYLALGLLEDSGYLPRLAVMADTLMHRLGLHGYAIIPTMLGLGCNVPGIMASRVLESKRKRFIVATLISIAVPMRFAPGNDFRAGWKAGGGVCAARLCNPVYHPHYILQVLGQI